MLDLLKQYLLLPPKTWNTSTPQLREALREKGFYDLPVNERESILQKAKNEVSNKKQCGDTANN